MKKFIVRTLSGALFVAILIGSILYGWQSFKSIFLVFMALAVNEFCVLLQEYKNITFKPHTAIVCSLCLYFGFAMVAHNSKVPAVLVFSPYMIAVVAVFIHRLFSKEGNNIENLAYFALTQLYVALPFCLLQTLPSSAAGQV